jgi:hypothetical protein
MFSSKTTPPRAIDSEIHVSVTPAASAALDARVDTRLIAAVQAAAGARCHLAANLVQAYRFSAAACDLAARHGTDDDRRDAREQLQVTKVKLRDFLAEQLTVLIADSRQRRFDRDWAVVGDTVLRAPPANRLQGL